MATCFVIQPFDRGGQYDKRYEDVLVPAIEGAGLEPYRVDRDLTTSVVIEAIERGIREARACVAEITEDRPNVWYELGYAFAARREVVLVCSEKRVAFPFDVQHRHVVTYSPEAPRDFARLRETITGRLKASLEKTMELESLATSPLRESEGLTPHEMVCLAVVMETSLTGVVWPHSIKSDMERAGFTPLAASLAVHSLLGKKLLEENVTSDINGERASSFLVTSSGQHWLLNNQDKLQLRSRKTSRSKGTPEDDGVPF